MFTDRLLPPLLPEALGDLRLSENLQLQRCSVSVLRKRQREMWGLCLLHCACLFNPGSSLTHQAANPLTLGLLALPPFSKCVSWLPPQTWHPSYTNPPNPPHLWFSPSAPFLSLGLHAALDTTAPCVANAPGPHRQRKDTKINPLANRPSSFTNWQMDPSQVQEKS